MPRYDLSRHANGETYYTYAGIRVAGSEVDITEAFQNLRTNATDAGPPQKISTAMTGSKSLLLIELRGMPGSLCQISSVRRKMGSLL